MKTLTILKYLAIPIFFTLGIEVDVAIIGGHRDVDSTRLVYGGLFYSAPHLLWAAITASGKPSVPQAHSGFLACTLSLFLISLVWLLPQDPSGLPIQWIIYWPLSLVLIIVGAVATHIWQKVSA